MHKPSPICRISVLLNTITMCFPTSYSFPTNTCGENKLTDVNGIRPFIIRRDNININYITIMNQFPIFNKYV